MVVDFGPYRYEFDGLVSGRRYEGRLLSPLGSPTLFSGGFRAEVVESPRFDGEATLVREFDVMDDISRVGLDEQALARLLAIAEDSESDGLVVIKDGYLICQRSFGCGSEAIDCRSITKGIVALAVGLLMEDGVVRSIDEPVSTYIEEWRSTPKEVITLRQVLSHESGFPSGEFGGSSAETDSSRPETLPGFREAARLPLSGVPGASIAYSDAAFACLGRYVHRASGVRVDQLLRDRVFRRIGVSPRWDRDAEGEPLTWVGVHASCADLAKLGVLLSQFGVWRGRQLISSQWVRQCCSTAASELNPGFALGWWLRWDVARTPVTVTRRAVESMRAAGVRGLDGWSSIIGQRGTRVSDVHVASSRRHAGVDFTRVDDATSSMVQPYEFDGPPVGFMHRGGFGSALLVYPEWRLVVARVQAPRASVAQSGVMRRVSWDNIAEAVEDLVRR